MTTTFLPSPPFVCRCFQQDCTWACDTDTLELASEAMTDHRTTCPGPCITLSREVLDSPMIRGQGIQRIVQMTFNLVEIQKEDSP